MFLCVIFRVYEFSNTFCNNVFQKIWNCDEGRYFFTGIFGKYSLEISFIVGVNKSFQNSPLRDGKDKRKSNDTAVKESP